MSQSIEDKVVARIYGHGRGWSFSQLDFRDLGRANMVLKRLADAGTIRRVLRGVYDYPRYSELLGQQMGPDIHEVAQALARKFAWRIQPDGTAAMNLLGLSTQIPSQYVFQSDGPDRSYTAGKTKIIFKNAALKEIGFKHDESGIIVHALKTLGEKHIDESVIAKIREWLPENKRLKVLKDTERVTGWIYTAIKRICREVDVG
ncbi:MAG: hypothetical protein KC931_13620 [Candidatus Omnitrophica bacterium]|nr:hypothetical protein [Candidatus Omnitrophota bacterium]